MTQAPLEPDQTKDMSLPSTASATGAGSIRVMVALPEAEYARLKQLAAQERRPQAEKPELEIIKNQCLMLN